MRLWAPLAILGVIGLAYTLFYILSVLEAQGGNPVGVANAVGLVAVLVGVIAAAYLLRRATPPQ